MPLLAYDTRPGVGVRSILQKDFQSHATPEVLKRNAVRAGIPAESVEIREVSEEKFAQLRDEAFAATRQARAAVQAQEDAETNAAADTLAVELGLDTPLRLRALARLVERGSARG